MQNNQRYAFESILIELITDEFPRNLINQALEAAVLHHWLDKIAGVIRDYGTGISENVKFIIDRAEGRLSIYISDDIYNCVRSFVKSNAPEIIEDITSELMKQGIADEIGPETFFRH